MALSSCPLNVLCMALALIYQQEGIDDFWAISVLKKVGAGVRNTVYDGQYLSCTVPNEEGSCHSLPLMELTDYILSLMVSVDQFIQAFTFRGCVTFGADSSTDAQML